MFIGKVKWSPVELSYLKEHRNDPLNQLTIALAKSRNAIQKKLDELDGKLVTKAKNKKSIIGKRADLNQFTRSAWEANFLRYLNYKKIKWEYEPQVFYFEGIKHGTVSYTPDVKMNGKWIEIKGYLDAKSKTAIRRFKKFHPKEFSCLYAITGSKNAMATKFFQEMNVPILHYYQDLNKQYKNIIPNWE